MLRSETKHADLLDRAFSRILLVKPSSLGDVIHALPVLHGLRLRYPQARIDWLVGSTFAPILERHAAISNLIRFDRTRYGRMWLNPKAALSFVRLLRDLRETRYELVVDIQGLFRSGFMTWTTRAPIRIGLAETREGARAFYTHLIPKSGENTHAVDRYYALASMLGFDDVPVTFPLPISEQARTSACRLLDAGPDQPQVSSNPKNRDASRRNEQTDEANHAPPTILFAPGARWETKRWPAEHFVSVIDSLTLDGARCVLVGGKDEAETCAYITAHCRISPLNLAGGTTLPELVALVDAADIVVCHDSALAHIAVAREKPIVCITGPTNPLRTGPYRGGVVVREAVDCAPCYLRRLSQCPHDHRCMTGLETGRVLAAVQEALNRRSSMPAVVLPITES